MTDWQDRVISFGRKPAHQFLAHEDNARRHPGIQREALRGSLETIGNIGVIIENITTGKVIDGHARIEEALTRNEDMELAYIQVELEPHEEAQALASYDFISSLAEYDKDSLATLFEQVATDDARVQATMSKLAEDHDMYFGDDNDELGGNPEAQLNRAEEWQEKYQVERGQVWQIGRHRLMCGDSYNETHLELLLDGKTPDLLQTDPPYGINIVKPVSGKSTASDGGSKPFGSSSDSQRKGKTAIAFRNRGKVGGGVGALIHQHQRQTGRHIAVNGDAIVQANVYPVIEGDDKPFEPEFLLDLAPILVLWGANYYADKLPNSSGWIVWDKRENITRNNFADCEMAWTNQKKPSRIFYHLWNGLHKGSQHGQRRLHPTEKPVDLFKEIGNLYAPQGLWLDLFAGAGGQIVAAEQTGATCYALEYEPLYVATILERMSAMGCDPYKIEND